MDHQSYQSVLDTCDLNRDLSNMPLFDQTIIGRKGASSSGGQRHRQVLARAVYARKSIPLIDNILSSLDAQTSQTVFNSVAGQGGLARRWGVVVILITDNERHLQQADNTIILQKNLYVEKYGDFEELNSRDIMRKCTSKTTEHIPTVDLRCHQPRKLQQYHEEARPIQTTECDDAQQDLAGKLAISLSTNTT